MVNELERVIKRGVREYMKKVPRPFVLLLSGGLDSAYLAHLIKPDLVLTCRFPYGKKYDEYSYSKKVVKHLGLKQVTLTVTEKDFREHIAHAVYLNWGVTPHFSLIPLFMLFQKAIELGFKHVISAEGPDEYLGGYAAYSFITHEQELYNQPELETYHYSLDKYLGSPMERFARTIPVEPEKLKKWWGKYKFLISKMGYSDLKVRGIEEMELKLAKGWGVKLHYPFMTKEIAEFCFEKIPDHWKIRGFTTKYIQRKIMEKYFPKDIVWRKQKIGGPVLPVGKFLNQKDEFDKTKYLEMQEILHKNQIKWKELSQQ